MLKAAGVPLQARRRGAHDDGRRRRLRRSGRARPGGGAGGRPQPARDAGGGTGDLRHGGRGMTSTAEHTTVDARVDRLRTAADEAGLDAVLVTNDASIAYFTGFWGMQLERLFAVAVPVSGGGALVVPRLEEDAVAGAPVRPRAGRLRPDLRRHPRADRGARRRRPRRRRGGPPRLRPRRGAESGRLRPVRGRQRWSWACACARTPTRSSACARRAGS